MCKITDAETVFFFLCDCNRKKKKVGFQGICENKYNRINILYLRLLNFYKKILFIKKIYTCILPTFNLKTCMALYESVRKIKEKHP